MLTSGGAEAESPVQTEPLGSPGTQPSGPSNTSDEHWGLEKPLPSLAVLAQGLRLPTPPPHPSAWAGLRVSCTIQEGASTGVCESTNTASIHRNQEKRNTDASSPLTRSSHNITLFREDTLRISTRPSDFLSRPSDPPLEPAPSAILHQGRLLLGFVSTEMCGQDS